jgi:integrase
VSEIKFAVNHLRLVNNESMTGINKQSYVLPRQWESAVDGWLSWLRYKGASETTLRTRRGQVRVIARLSKTKSPGEIDLSILFTLCGKPGYSADHRHGQRAALISFFTWCMENGVTHDNPAAKLPTVKASQPRPRPTPDEVWTNLLSAAPPREALMALLACEAGLRRAEVAGLHSDNLARELDGWVLIVHGKGDKQRVVPINATLAQRIRQHRPNGGYIFPGAVDGHMAPDSVGRILSRLMPDGWTMHKLRHRYATRGFYGTRNLLAVQKALGHSSIATTERYTAISMDDVRAVSEAAKHDWGKLLASPKSFGEEQDWERV